MMEGQIATEYKKPSAPAKKAAKKK